MHQRQMMQQQGGLQQLMWGWAWVLLPPGKWVPQRNRRSHLRMLLGQGQVQQLQT